MIWAQVGFWFGLLGGFCLGWAFREWTWTKKDREIAGSIERIDKLAADLRQKESDL